MRRTPFWVFSISVLLVFLVANIAFAISIEEIAGSFRKNYANAKNFSADFEETKIIADKKLVAKGKLVFQKPNLLRQEYADPSNPKNTTQLTVSDGKILWSYTPLISQVIKQTLSQDGSRTELLPGFGHSLENVEKNYSLGLVADDLAEKSGVHVVELIPRNQVVNTSAMFDVLRVWIRDKDSVPVQFMYRDRKNEMTYVLSFKNIKINQELVESTFRFEVPKGVQVITVPSR